MHGTQIVKNIHEMFFNARPEQVTEAMHFYKGADYMSRTSPANWAELCHVRKYFLDPKRSLELTLCSSYS